MGFLISFLKDIWDFLSGVPGALAVVTGFISGLLFTQRYKFSLSDLLKEKDRTYKIRRFSLFAGGIPCLLLWPLTFKGYADMSTLKLYGIVVGGILATGVTACSPPVLYPLVMNFLYRRGWVDKKKWSADAKVDEKRKLREDLIREMQEAGVGDETLLNVIKSRKSLEEVKDIHDQTIRLKHPIKLEPPNS